MDRIVIAVFCLCLTACVVFNISIVYAMIFGVVLFGVYALIKGFSFSEVIKMMLSGVLTAKNVLIALVLVGMMTALWRSAGTIPAIVTYASKLISPGIFILITFLLNCLVAFLMGTSLGTAATMGVICVTIGRTMGIDPFFVGGAVLSGTYFGDRCSPVSTSALLVSTITETDLYDNIKKMFRTAAVPFCVTCVVYLIIGFCLKSEPVFSDTAGMFAKEFEINIIALIPAVLILILALFRINVKISMSVSIAAAFVISVFLQGREPLELLKFMLMGFKCNAAELSSMIDGGGIKSMLKVICIITCSLAFSGVFNKTGITGSFKSAVQKLADKTGAFAATAIVSVLATAVGSNQTLAVMLTDQLCCDIEPDNKKRAVNYENTVILISATIPWSTASSVALTAATAPISSILLAVYLFLVPLYNLVVDIIKSRKIPVKN